MNTKRGPIPAARQMLKRVCLPFLTWPAYRVLRWAGYYRKRPELARVDRILLALHGGIGNVVLATPMVKAVHEGFPESDLHVWCQAGPAAEICRAIPYVNKVLVDGEDAICPDYDLFVANCVAPPLRASLFGLLSGAAVRAGEDQTKSHLGFLFNRCSISDVSLHEVDRNLGILRSIGLSPSETGPFVNVGSEHRAAGLEALGGNVLPGRPMVGLHPGCGAGQSFKRWGRSKFAELTRRLSVDHRMTVLLFGGPEETELAEAIADESGHGRVIAGRASLLEAAAMIERCRIFISNDSGLMHIAAAVGTLTIGIFGPTRPQKNRPYGQDHVVVTAGMPCQPCYTAEGKIKCDGAVPCMEAVSVEQVLAVAVEALRKLKSTTGSDERILRRA